MGNNIGTITASYATGDAAAGGAFGDSVGGLVGNNASTGTITASYATGDAAARGAFANNAGGLVGNASSTITTSYGFGTATGTTIQSDGTGADLPTGVTTASGLTAANAGTTASSFWWDEASSTGAGAWNFGDGTENPALVYSDYDGATGNIYPSCSQAEGLFLTIPGTTTQIVCGTTLVGNFRP